MAQAKAKARATGGAGWVYFASMMMLILGGLQIISGLVALFNSGFFIVTQQGLIAWDYASWGWIHLGTGGLIAIMGAAVASGKTWTRVIASLLIVLAAIDNITFLPAYPVWSTIALVICIFVLYALTVHGRDGMPLRVAKGRA